MTFVDFICLFLFLFILIYFFKTSYFKRFLDIFNEFSKRNPNFFLLFLFIILFASLLVLILTGAADFSSRFTLDDNVIVDGGSSSNDIKDEIPLKVLSKDVADEGFLFKDEITDVASSNIPSKAIIDESPLDKKYITVEDNSRVYLKDSDIRKRPALNDPFLNELPASDNLRAGHFPRNTLVITASAAIWVSEITDPDSYSDTVQPCRAPGPSYVEFAGAGESGIAPLNLRTRIDDLLESRFSHKDNEYHLTVDDEKDLRCLFFELYSPKPLALTTHDYMNFLHQKNIKIIQN